ncbi:hypothetical protein N9N67_03925 [Bacteriovoracaceae bacterium]|nr:hypothetical protein [Bacteriovoracaceae bacterium]
MKYLCLSLLALLILNIELSSAQDSYSNVQTNNPLVTCNIKDLLWNNIVDNAYGVAVKVGSPKNLFQQKKPSKLQFERIGEEVTRTWVIDQPILEREATEPNFTLMVQFELKQDESSQSCLRVGYTVKTIDEQTNITMSALGYTEYFGSGCIPKKENKVETKINQLSKKYLLKHTYAERSGILSDRTVKIAILGIGLSCQLN